MKKYIVFAGVNGAGKTTLYQTNYEIHEMPRINIDEIVRKDGDWKKKEDVIKAGLLAVRLVKRYIDEGISFNQETTLCGKSIIKNIKKAKEKDYKIELYYVGVNSPETAIERVKARVLAGGHGIPEEDIRRRYKESLNNLKKIIPICDRVELFDNTVKFRHIAVFEYGKCLDIDDSIPNWCAGICALYA